MEENSIQEAVESPKEKPTIEKISKDTDAILDAIKELTKIVGNLAKEHEIWRKAGKF